MVKRIGLLAVLVCIMILSGCNKPKVEDKNPKVNTSMPPDSKDADKVQDVTTQISLPNLTTEEGIKEYLVGEWIFDKEYVSDVVCDMNIDKDLNVQLSFRNADTDESKGDYTGQIKFDRLYANDNEVPDLIVIELINADYPGGDFLFLHRTIYNGKRVMSLFSAGNGNCIFDMLADIDNSEYAPAEIIFEKASGEMSQLRPRKNDEFQAVLWGKRGKGQSLWIDDVKFNPTVEDEFESLSLRQMALYENDVTESVLYSVAPDKVLDIVGEDLIPGEVYLVKTDENGRIIDFTKANTDGVDSPEDLGYALFEKSDIGKKEIVKSKKEIELIKESGPFTIKVTDMQVLKFVLFDEYKEDFDNKDTLTFIAMGVEVENNSTDTNAIYPELGMVVTNTKEEAEADLMLSDSAGGEFKGGSVKKGNLVFMIDSQAQDIKKIRYIIDGANDDDFNSIGEDIEFEIEF